MSSGPVLPGGMNDPGHPEDRYAAALRGFGPTGLAAIAIILGANLLMAPLGAVLVLYWARRSGTPWREIGYVRPKSWLRTLTLGIALGVVLKLVLKSIVMPLLGADPINHHYQYLVGNTAAAVPFIFQLLIVAGWGEETVYRGWMFERLGKLLGSDARAKLVTVLLTSGIFGAIHYFEQGVPGVQQSVVVGLVFGSIFARTGTLPMLMMAHAVFDLTALAIIYWNLENAVATFFFK